MKNKKDLKAACSRFVLLFGGVLYLLLMASACNNAKKPQEEKGVPISHESPLPSKKQSRQNAFEGAWQWEKNNESKNFSVTIKNVKDTLFLSYCAVFQNGQKIDCPENNAYSFKIATPATNSIKTKFKTYFSAAEGVVELTLNNGELIWKIKEAPDAEFYCPVRAVLKKE